MGAVQTPVMSFIFFLNLCHDVVWKFWEIDGRVLVELSFFYRELTAFFLYLSSFVLICCFLNDGTFIRQSAAERGSWAKSGPKLTWRYWNDYYWNLRNSNLSFEMARANVDRFAIEKSSRFSSWFHYSGNSCRIAYFIVQLSNLCSRHCRPSRPAPNSPNWTSSSWRAPTSPISADWSRSTTTAATSSSSSSQRISIQTTAPLSTPSRYVLH